MRDTLSCCGVVIKQLGALMLSVIMRSFFSREVVLLLLHREIKAQGLLLSSTFLELVNVFLKDTFAEKLV